MTTDTPQYKTGDILVTPTMPVPLFDHFAIVFYYNNKGYVAHNSFLKKTVVFDPLDEFCTTRKILRVIKPQTKLSDDGIYKKALYLNQAGKKYNFFGYNCESFVREACGCDIGIDQRELMLIIIGILVYMSILLYSIRRSL